VIDSCSIKVSPVRGPRGFNGVKKIDGIKRHVVVDTLACWWPCLSPRPASRIGRRCPGCSAEPATAAPGLGHLWAEQGYTGSVVQAVSRILRFTIQIIGGINLKGGFITQPRRWVVERTFAWMHRCRRLTASTSRPYWPMKPWSSSASSRSCSAA
jgi:transposase